VARFETSLVIPRPLAATFAFVTDLRNASRWDPRTYEARKITEGDIGLGTRFLLLGGLLTEATLERFHIPELLRGVRELPYEVVSFIPRREMVVRGETSALRYEDQLVFSAEGDATRLRYVATMELHGALHLGEPLLDSIFEAIGADATRRIPAAVEAALPAARAAAVPPLLPATPIISPDDVRRVVALDDHSVLRNLLITQGYHDLSKAIAARTGGADMNWCTLGSWASKTAGAFIRGDEVPAVFRRWLDGPGPHREMIDDAHRELQLGGDAATVVLVDIVRDIIRDIVHDCSTYIATGNRVVYAEFAQCYADFHDGLGGDRSPDPDKLAAFQLRYRDGDPEPDAVERRPDRTLVSQQRGGQARLREMVGCLYRAMFEADPKRRAEEILLANALGGLHEQTRLQTYIVGGLDAPIIDTLVAWGHRHVDRDIASGVERGELPCAINAMIPRLGHLIERAWQVFSTDLLMTLTLPDGVLHLGRPLPQDPGGPLFPPALQTIDDPALAAVLDRYGALDVQAEHSAFDWLRDQIRALLGLPRERHDELADVGAVDWASFDQRMRFILTLFRMRQQDPHLFQQPFTDPMRAAMFEGRVPPGPL
jgi:hypothetical protein